MRQDDASTFEWMDWDRYLRTDCSFSYAYDDDELKTVNEQAMYYAYNKCFGFNDCEKLNRIVYMEYECN